MKEKDLFTSYNIKHIIALILAAHKQPKEAIHLSLKVKDGVKTYKFQILIIFRIDGDPSIYFGEGLYLENDKVLMRISHRDSEWESTIEKCGSSLSGWDKKAHSILAMITGIEPRNITARQGEESFIFKDGTLYPYPQTE